MVLGDPGEKIRIKTISSGFLGAKGELILSGRTSLCAILSGEAAQQVSYLHAVEIKLDFSWFINVAMGYFRDVD